MKSLLLDNYDSFTHILFQYLWEVNGEKPLLIRNDEWSLAEIRNARFDNIVISPGPGHPGERRDFGICGDVIAAFPDRPILGVCLGMQGLGLAAGVKVIPAPAVRHGKHSPIHHDGEGVFAGLPRDFPAVRYHSLVLDPAGASAAAGLRIAATALDDGQIMGIRFADKPFHGLQFHPESIGTDAGKALLANFRDLSARRLSGRGRAAADRATTVLEIPAAAPRGTAAGRMLAARELPWRDPEAAFARFFKDGEAAFWLDSLSEPVPGEPRVTYMGAGRRLIEARGDRVRILEASGSAGFQESAASRSDPFAYLGAYLAQAETCRLPETLGFPGSFTGGLVGWFGYGLKRFADGSNLPDTQASDLPDALFLEPDRILAFDAGRSRVRAFLPLGPKGGAPSAEAALWLDRVAAEWDSVGASELGLRRIVPAEPKPPADAGPPGPQGASSDGFRLPWRLSAPKGEYLARIRGLQDAILRGETYEACLTNEWRAPSGAEPFEVYRRLRRINPAPYAAYLRFPQAGVLCASPERFLKLDARGGLACRPIKGTRARGATPGEDRALREDLAGNAKDRSENLMIVDLVRNDFGKVCALGSVRAPELMQVEGHPTVWQLVSTVLGDLAAGRSAIDAVRACFPGGSMTGAPKLRTMELLAAAEGRPRGVFSGALGYLGWDGAMDLGMVIRTLIHINGEYRVGCGGAILAESDPEGEFAEAMLKAEAPRIAVELAEFGSAGNWQSAR